MTATNSNFVWDESSQSMKPIETAEVKAAVVAAEQVEETEELKTAKAKLAEAKRLLALAQGKTPGKRGKPKLYTYKRVTLGGQVAEDKLNRVKALMPKDASATDIVNLALDTLLEELEAKADLASQA